MRGIIFFIFTLLNCIAFSQSPAPKFINYQGVARDAAGNPVTTQTIGLKFKITTATNPSFFNEAQSVNTNSLGLFTTKIGTVTALPVNGWENTPCLLEVFIDVNGSGFISTGVQQLASVPYALYADKAGNALPTATLNGTTLSYSAAASKWVADTNLVSNGARVSVGNRAYVQNNKFRSIADNLSDSSAIFGLHKAAKDGFAGVRGFATGTSLPSATVTTTGIFGGHFFGYNILGQGIGVLGQGYSGNGNGIGIVGVGSSNGTSIGQDYAIGIYGTTDLNSVAAKKFAGVFENGGVFIRDSILLGSATNPGNVGDVLTLAHFGTGYARVKWQAPGGNAPWIKPTATVTALQNNADFVGIGTGGPQNRLTIEGFSSGTGYPYSSSPSTKVNIHNSGLTNLNYSSFAFTTINAASSAYYSSAEIVSENIDHSGGNIKGNLIFLTREPSNILERMRINWDGKIGINTSTPSALLDVNGSTKLGTNGITITNLIHGTGSVTLPNTFNSPGISPPLNLPVANVNTGDRIVATLVANSITTTYGVIIATATAGNGFVNIVLGALVSGTVPISTFTLNYIVIKP